MRQTISTTGRATTTIGLPGTGIYYTKSTNVKKLAKKFTSKKDDKDSKSSKSKPNTKTIENNKLQVEEYNDYIEAIKSVHKNSDGYIDWARVQNGDGDKDLIPFAKKVLEGDIDAYFEVIDEVKPFDDLLDFGSSFEVGTDDPSVLEVEFKVKSEEIVPELEYSLKADGGISTKNMSKTNYYALMQDYVASTTIRVARDAFALLPIESCVVHAVDKVLNTATGYEEEMTILSVEFKRDQLLSLNMDRIDPSDAIAGFNNNCKFAKTTGFKPVERIIPS